MQDIVVTARIDGQTHQSLRKLAEREDRSISYLRCDHISKRNSPTPDSVTGAWVKCTCAAMTLASTSRSGTEIHPALRRLDAFPESPAATPAKRPHKASATNSPTLPLLAITVFLAIRLTHQDTRCSVLGSEAFGGACRWRDPPFPNRSRSFRLGSITRKRANVISSSQDGRMGTRVPGAAMTRRTT